MQNDRAMKIDKPVTQEKVEALARSRAGDPATVVEVIHSGFNTDPVSGGFAFSSDRGLLMVNFEGDGWIAETLGDQVAPSATIEKWWQQLQHYNRHLDFNDISAWHRAAITAVVGGHRSVADLPEEQRLEITDTAVADFLLILLRMHTKEPTQAALLRTLARADWLLEPPKENNRAHQCPLCGWPAFGEDWGYINVCHDCFRKTSCPHERIVRGSNAPADYSSWALHADDDTVCELVSRSGIVTVDGHECHIGEAEIGGIYVGVLPPDTR